MGLMAIPRWISLLLAIYTHQYNCVEVRQATLRRTTGMTCGHIVKMLGLFKEKGLIKRRIDGRDNYIALTAKGMQICTLLHSTYKIINKGV